MEKNHNLGICSSRSTVLAQVADRWLHHLRQSSHRTRGKSSDTVCVGESWVTSDAQGYHCREDKTQKVTFHKSQRRALICQFQNCQSMHFKEYGRTQLLYKFGSIDPVISSNACLFFLYWTWVVYRLIQNRNKLTFYFYP